MDGGCGVRCWGEGRWGQEGCGPRVCGCPGCGLCPGGACTCGLTTCGALAGGGGNFALFAGSCPIAAVSPQRTSAVAHKHFISGRLQIRYGFPAAFETFAFVMLNLSTGWNGTGTTFVPLHITHAQFTFLSGRSFLRLVLGNSDFDGLTNLRRGLIVLPHNCAQLPLSSSQVSVL